MTVELTPELIAICLTFVGVLIGFGSIAVRVIKVGRWMERIEARLENLEEGQRQILSALQNHIHGPDGTPPLFYAAVPQTPSPAAPTAPVQSRGGETEVPA